MSNMSAVGQRVIPRQEFDVYHSRKYQVFKELYEDQIKYKAMMDHSE